MAKGLMNENRVLLEPAVKGGGGIYTANMRRAKTQTELSKCSAVDTRLNPQYLSCLIPCGSFPK